MDENSTNKNAQPNVVDKESTLIFQSKEKDNKYDYFSERAKKLTTAIYLVTNLIPQTDPLRIYIRRYSVKLLSFVGKAPAGYSIAETSTEIIDLARKVVEMLEIAFFSGYVSEMNFSVLKSEFDSFINEISGYEKFQNPINPGSLKVKTLPASGTPKMAQNSHKTPISEPRSVAARPSTPRAKNVVEAKKTSRKESILSIIKRRGTVSIKDISSVIINVSEKTIQRELMTLVDEGTLKKTGDRRWSVYSLAD